MKFDLLSRKFTHWQWLWYLLLISPPESDSLRNRLKF